MRLGTAPVPLTEDAADDLSRPIDQHGVRMAPHPERRGTVSGAVDPEREANAEVLSELADGLRLLLQIDTDDLQAACPERLIERCLGGSLPPAVRSPRREEAQEDGFSAQVAHADLRAVERGEGDVGRGLGRGRPENAHRVERVGARRRAGEHPHEGDACDAPRRQRMAAH